MSLKNVRILDAAGTTSLAFLCWLPSLGPGANSWQIRLICLLLLLPLATALICFYILKITEPEVLEKQTPLYIKNVEKACRSLFKIKESKKSEEKPPKDFKTLKRICRIGLILTILFFTVGIILPLEWSGLRALSGVGIKSISVQVTDNDVEYGAWFLAQKISVGNKEDQQEFYYILGSIPIWVGQRYKFLILQGYPIIFQHTKIDEE